MTIPIQLRIALWIAEITDRFARWLAGDTLAQRLVEFDAIDVPYIDRGEFVYETTPAPVIALDAAARRRHARQRHPAGRALTK